MSGPSMRRETASKSRLIMFVAFLARIELERRCRLLAEEVVVEHLARDGRRRRAAVLPVLHQHRDGEPGILGGREGHEERMVPMLSLHPLLVVFLVLLHADHLRRSGL